MSNLLARLKEANRKLGLDFTFTEGDFPYSDEIDISRAGNRCFLVADRSPPSVYNVTVCGGENRDEAEVLLRRGQYEDFLLQLYVSAEEWARKEPL